MEANEKKSNEEEMELQVEDITEEVEVEAPELKEDYESKYKEELAKSEEYFNQLQRVMAEFDNFRKRTIKEKEALYAESVKDVISTFLPLLDNLERAVEASQDTQAGGLKEGVEMVLRQFKDLLHKTGVEPIEAVGNSFDPELHNAVMHVEDTAFGLNEVIEEFQKGYTYKGKVIRHSMVKVAN